MEKNWLAERFEENRNHLMAVAYRMLGSATEADDAVQEAWLRLSRSDADEIKNLGAWLTTVVSRVCLDMLRSRTSRREESLGEQVLEPVASGARAQNPEQEAVLADAVGLALMVVLQRLSPAERLSFVLHDMFGVSFEEIASIIGKTPAATRQLATRARRKVQGEGAESRPRLSQEKEVAEAFLAALRAGDVQRLIAVLDPDVVVRVDEFAARVGGPREIRGAENWARGAVAFSQMARSVQPVLVDGLVGMVLAPGGHLQRVLTMKFKDGKIADVEIIGDPKRLAEMELAVI